MKWGGAKIRLIAEIKRFARDEEGANLLEFAIVAPLFLLLFFGLIDFGLMAFHYVNSEKTMQMAARIAAVRPPACAEEVPPNHVRDPSNTGTNAPKFGTRCNAAGNVCAVAAAVSCTGNISNPTVAEIWPKVQWSLPFDATPANLRFRYEYDANLGFLGGPYVPVVTVEIENLKYSFVTPIGALAELAMNGIASSLGEEFDFPSLSVSLPSEDLAHGDSG